jgi:branched-chain amino acid transport system substrate-binding protein
MKTKGLLTLGVITCLVLVTGLMPFISGCAPTPTPEVKTLKIGCTLPFNVALGVEMNKYLDVVYTKINEAGGLLIGGQRYKVELIVYDDKYSADAGRAAVERLIYQDKVQFMVGQFASAAIVAGLPIAEAEGILSFVGCASAKVIDPAIKYTVRGAGTSTTESAVRAWIMANRPVKTLVTLSPDDETGKAMSSIAVKCAKAYGIEVLEQLYYPRGTTDFSAVATRIASLNPDEVNFAGSSGGTDLGLQLKELYRAGWTGVKYLPAFTLNEVASVCTNEQMEGALVRMRGTDAENPSKVAAELVSGYEKKYGAFNNAAVDFIGGTYAFLAAVEKADSLDPTDILVACEGLEFDCPMGYGLLVRRPDYGNNRFCDTVTDCYIGEIQDGQPVLVGKYAAKDVVKASEKIFGGGEWR